MSTFQCWLDSPRAQTASNPTWCRGEPYTRTVMADFPESGSSWLFTMLAIVAASSALPDPSCAIQDAQAVPPGMPGDNVEPNLCNWGPGLFCMRGEQRRCGELGKPKNALVKTYFPAGDNPDPRTSEYSLCFDKLLVLTRHPLGLVRANRARAWGYGEEQLACWGETWSRTIESRKGKGVPVLQVKYEDLCLHTRAELAKVLAFLGMPSSAKALDRALAGRSEADCKYTAADIKAMQTPTSADDRALMARFSSANSSATFGGYALHEAAALGGSVAAGAVSRVLLPVSPSS